MADFSDANLKEDHQKKLSAFLVDIPALGAGKLTSTMHDSAILKSPFTKAQLDGLEGVKSNPKFYTYTGYTQQMLLNKWLTDKTTTCNEFCSKCGVAMGYVAQGNFDGVGRFDIADYLTRYGRGHCWVPAQSGSKPEYGDVFRIFELSPDRNGTNRNHMGVSLFVDGTDWFTVESGQGGPSDGFDAIERKKRDWMPSSLMGWVNMKALMSAGKLLPYWLGGWWKIEQDPYETWYYYFAAGGKVICSTEPPKSLSHPPIGAPLIGNFTIKGAFGLEISWQSADVDETFTVTQQDNKARKFAMQGVLKNSSAKIAAKRLMITGLL